MRAVILLAVVDYVASQSASLGILLNNSDIIHEYTFENHRSNRLLLVRDSITCFIVEVDQDVAGNLEDEDYREMLEEAIFRQINSGQGETISFRELRAVFHDTRAAFECRGHDVRKLRVHAA